MKPDKIDLGLKRLARATYFNAVRLYKDACFLYINESYPTAYFCVLSSMEEIGKLKLIDHFYADMRLNYEALGHPRKIFIDALFSRGNFYNHRTKHSSAKEGTMFDYMFEMKDEYIEMKKWLSDPERDRQESMYVDMVNWVVLDPQTSVAKSKVKKALEIGLHLIENVEDMGFAGTYWVDSIRTRRKALVVVENLRRLFKKC